MAQTDRQTDTKARGNYWSLTIYDPGEYSLFTNKESFPNWVKRTAGQQEKCPTTGKLHWQCMLHTEQVRFSSVKKWMPTAHIELARNKNALEQYVSKAESAVDGTRFDCKTDREYLALHQQLEMLAKCYLVAEDEILKMVAEVRPAELDKKVYWYLANMILAGDPTLASMLANPALERMWINTRGTWVALARESSEEGGA